MKKIYTAKDFTVSELINYGVDHLASAEKLYRHSSRSQWRYLHSAAFLSHLGIELILKAWLLHHEGKFPEGHDLITYFQKANKSGNKLSKENNEWLVHLNKCNMLRYPDSGKGPEVNVRDWERTETLYNELKTLLPKDYQKQVILGERYHSNVKSEKTI
jgi:HEPN domain-containing protein